MEKLKFGINGNAKLGKNIATFSLLSGWSCPGAKQCYTKVVSNNDGKLKIEDGKDQVFRCFSASQEVLYKNVYNNRKHNYDILMNIVKQKISSKEKINQIYNLFKISLPDVNKWSILRLHVGGDIFCQEYFDALIRLANDYKDKIFYAYTKSIHFWVKRLNDIPSNFKLTASYGGKYDNLISEYNLKSVKVVMSEEEAVIYNLELDHDDSHAYGGDKDFALLLHGSQRKNSEAAKAKVELAKKGWTGYSTNNNKNKLKKDMLNLVQYKDLKLYLMLLNITLNNIKNIKNVYNRDLEQVIDYKQNDIIYSKVKILDKISFDYEDIQYVCFKVSQMANNNSTKWICNCDANVEIYSVYEDVPVVEVKNTIVNDFNISEEYVEFLNNYEVSFIYDTNTLVLSKTFDFGIYRATYNHESNSFYIAVNNNKLETFINSCEKINVLPGYLLKSLYNTYKIQSNNYNYATIINIDSYEVNHFYYINSDPRFKITDKVVLTNNNKIKIVKDITWNNHYKKWEYILTDNNGVHMTVDGSQITYPTPVEVNIKDPAANVSNAYREDKAEKIRPDLISPYFLEVIGKLMRDNNEKYPEYNYMGLKDDSFYQSLWRHFVAYSEQRLFGVSDEFNSKEDHLAAIAFNVMGLIHNREVAKLKA